MKQGRQEEETKEVREEEREVRVEKNKCRGCGRVFATGQGLGGHLSKKESCRKKKKKKKI